MSNYIGDFPEDEANIVIPFTTNDASGGTVAPSTAFEAADIKIYKDGGATQKTSTNGLTMTSPFDSITGCHILAIDTSNDTGDAGFWVTGSDYMVVLDPSDETVDGQTVVAVLGIFSIENRFMRGTDGANTTVPDAAGVAPTAAENATAVLTTQMAESYAADGVAPTLAQMNFMMWAFYTQMAIAGTTGTANELDGSTPAMTFTFNDATDPTSITRAT
jgi:hypothetical protein